MYIVCTCTYMLTGYMYITWTCTYMYIHTMYVCMYICIVSLHTAVYITSYSFFFFCFPGILQKKKNKKPTCSPPKPFFFSFSFLTLRNEFLLKKKGRRRRKVLWKCKNKHTYIHTYIQTSKKIPPPQTPKAKWVNQGFTIIIFGLLPPSFPPTHPIIHSFIIPSKDEMEGGA